MLSFFLNTIILKILHNIVEYLNTILNLELDILYRKLETTFIFIIVMHVKIPKQGYYSHADGAIKFKNIYYHHHHYYDHHHHHHQLLNTHTRTHALTFSQREQQREKERDREGERKIDRQTETEIESNLSIYLLLQTNQIPTRQRKKVQTVVNVKTVVTENLYSQLFFLFRLRPLAILKGDLKPRFFSLAQG